MLSLVIQVMCSEHFPPEQVLVDIQCDPHLETVLRMSAAARGRVRMSGYSLFPDT